MHFNLFEGKRLFTVVKDSKIYAHLTTLTARNRVHIHGIGLFKNMSGSGYSTIGELILPAGTMLELLGYTMPYYHATEACTFKLKMNFNNTGTKLGTFYLYTNISSLENIDLEPCE
jgi:hypothetical protein